MKVKRHLRTMVKMIKSARSSNGWKYSCVEEFILKNGRSFTSKSFLKIKHGKMKECFRNAFILVNNLSNEFLYVEGYATTSLQDFPILHAWCIDKDGRILDPTWRDGNEYFGVPFDLDYVCKTIFKRKKFGVIDNFEMGFPLLTGEDAYDV